MLGLMTRGGVNGLMEQLPKLLRSIGVQFKGTEVETSKRREAVLGFVKMASAEDAKLIQLDLDVKGEKMRGLFLIVE